MRHRVAGYKLGRTTAHRRAMFRNLAVALITHGHITTTLPKAKAVRPMVEKLITLARKGNATRLGGGSDIAYRRRIERELGGDRFVVDRDLTAFTRAQLRSEGYRVNKYYELKRGPRVINKLFDDIAPRYEDRSGGYTRIVRLGKHRKGDGGDLCVLMFVGEEAGPQLGGQYSRRREKANRRAERAAQLRRGGAAAATAASTAPAAVEETLEPVSESLEPLEPLEAQPEDQPEAATEQEGDQAEGEAPDQASEPDEPRKDNPGT